MNDEAIESILSKNPSLQYSKEKLMALKPGTFCVHRSWGVGQIRDYDESEGKLVIDFEDNKAGHSMDPAFALKTLEVLDENHLIVRQRKNPAEIEDLIKKRQTDLIVDILSATEEQTASSGEIERQLSRLLGEDKYKKWWTATKKLLVKDARIAVPKKKTEPYVLRDEPVKAEDEVLEDFYITQSIKKQIEHADKLLALSVKHEDIKEQLPEILRTLTEGLKETKQLNQGERLHGIWIRNDLARFIHEDVEQLEPTSASIILQEIEHRDLQALSENIPASHQKRFLDLIFRTLPDQWEKIIFDLLRNSDGKFTTECITFLMEQKKSAELEKMFHRWLNEQALKAPILIWILKNRHSRKYSKMLQGLISPRLLNAAFQAIDNEALNAGNRRIPLGDYLSDDAEVIQELLSEANPETARDLATTLLLNQGFEDLTKKSLLARFIRLFPSIQSLVSGAADSPSKAQSEMLMVSRESLEARKSEYEHLVKVKIPENKEAIATAREHGDLKENSEYKMARQDQDTLLARKAQLEQELGRAQIIDFAIATTDVVGIGTVVELRQNNNKKPIKYAILGAWDSKPEKNILSYKTPLGQSLLAKRVGETVETVIANNKEEWTILSIERWVDTLK